MRPKAHFLQPIERRWVGLGLAALVAGFAGCGTTDSAPSAGAPIPLVVLNGTLWDGTGAPPIADGVVVISGSRIVAAGPRSELSIPPRARRIDARGGTILPGLIDAHVHLSPALRRGEDVLTPWLEAGVTTLVDMGTALEIEELFRLAAGVAPRAPRILPAGPIWTAPGGYPFVGPGSSANELGSPDEARERVSAFLEGARVSLIKTAFERGFLEDLEEPGWPVWDRPVLRAVAETAQRFDLPAAVHLTGSEELRVAVEAGFDIIAHTPSEPISGDVLAAAAGRGVTLVTTVDLWEEPQRITTACENLRRYLDLGGRIALGTDAPTFSPPGFPATEVERLLAGGLSMRQILLAATRDAALALRRGDTLGTLTAGKRADLVVVGGDPFEDASVLSRPRVVLSDGDPVELPRRMVVHNVNQ